LFWNALLLAQAWYLFVHADARAADYDQLMHRRSDPQPVRASTRWGPSFARLAVAFACLAPLGERSGYWDHWPSWALYSPHASRAEIEIHQTATPRIDASIRKRLDPPSATGPWCRLQLGRWSIETLGVPIYPQARYQLAVARRLGERYELADAIRVTERGPSDRWTGRRTESRWIGTKEVAQALERYWLVSRSSR
jgi:hypothetical protein